MKGCTSCCSFSQFANFYFLMKIYFRGKGNQVSSMVYDCMWIINSDIRSNVCT